MGLLHPLTQVGLNRGQLGRARLPGPITRHTQLPKAAAHSIARDAQRTGDMPDGVALTGQNSVCSWVNIDGLEKPPN